MSGTGSHRSHAPPRRLVSKASVCSYHGPPGPTLVVGSVCRRPEAASAPHVQRLEKGINDRTVLSPSPCTPRGVWGVKRNSSRNRIKEVRDRPILGGLCFFA